MNTYTHLIAITDCPAPSLIKEYLDIALVSASYDIPTVIFLANDVVTVLSNNTSPIIEQSLNMVADFDIELFTEQCADCPSPTTLYRQTLSIAPLSTLKAHCKHHFIF